MQDENNSTPLHWAVNHKSKEVVEILCAFGADTNIINTDNLTPLHYTLKHETQEIVEILCKHGANVNSFNINNSILNWSAIINNTLVAKVLCAYGADANMKRDDGIAPLHIAVKNNNKELAEILIAHGANVNTLDNNNSTILHWSIINKKFAYLIKNLDSNWTLIERQYLLSDSIWTA